MLNEGTRRALSSALYDAGFTGVARLIAEGTTDVYELVAGTALYDAIGDKAERDGISVLQEAYDAAKRTGAAQLVLVTPDGEGEWIKPDLVGVIEATLKAPGGESLFTGASEPGELTEEGLVAAMSGFARELRRAPSPEEWQAAQDGTGPGIKVHHDGDGTTYERIPQDRGPTPDPFGGRGRG